ncbi:glutathione peroxidase [Variovorax soli]|uniref:glutathione peroxidase n=1 Tax=Variovorax soli TaxID=376815 RepID=UPI00083889C2|nr:glutathione peroxidase [Variovorax soli]
MPHPFRLTVRTLLSAAAGALLALAGGAHGQSAPPPASGAAYPASCPSLLRQSFDRLQDEKPQSLCQYAGKVLLVVNTASFCGFTRQYEGLEALDRKYRANGLVVLGFPSNDFAQETGSNKEVADFCENTFGVKFPMFVKSAVRGSDANPLFKELARQTGTTPKWNFYKYLVGRDGKVVAAYSSLTEPDDRDLLAALQKQLAQPAH